MTQDKCTVARLGKGERGPCRIRQRVNEIPFQKGSAGWLRKFITIMWQNGLHALEIYGITPNTLFELKMKSLHLSRDGETYFPAADKNLLSFFKKYGFTLTEKQMYKGMGFKVEVANRRVKCQ